MTGGEWLSIHEPVLPADGLTCCRLKQIDSPAEIKGEREGVYSRTCSPTCVCIMHEHSTCKLKVRCFRRGTMLYVVVKRIIKIMTRGHKQVNVGIFLKRQS